LYVVDPVDELEVAGWRGADSAERHSLFELTHDGEFGRYRLPRLATLAIET